LGTHGNCWRRVLGGSFRGEIKERQLQKGSEEVFSTTLALELVPLEIINEAL